MAFDALRLRNVIQLAGILGMSLFHPLAFCGLSMYAMSVFYAALVVFAGIQVHETRTALVRKSNCDGSVSYVVSRISTVLRFYRLSYFGSSAAAVAPCTRRLNTSSLPSRVSLPLHGWL
jgi:hypothetical protein